MPQSVDAIQSSPHPPPRFDVSDPVSFPTYLVDVPILTLFRQGSTDVARNCHCVIVIPELRVIEDDPTVDLTVHWFIDYNLSVPRTLAPWPGHDQPLPGIFDDPLATQRKINGFTFDADEANIVVSGTHTLEVVVGETGGFNTDSTAILPNRSMKTGYTAAVYKFVIDVHIEQTVTQCPGVLPSVRVCQ